MCLKLDIYELHIYKYKLQNNLLNEYVGYVNALSYILVKGGVLLMR